MECKKIQDQLITEYGDKELGPAEQAKVEKHLAQCPNCREFFETLRTKAVVPFKEAVEMQPDNAVWQKIQEMIETERSRSKNGFWERMDAWIPILRTPQPVFRLAFLTALIVAVVALAKWPSGYADPVYGYISDQMTFMNGLQAGNMDILNEGLNDYEGAFEEIEI